VPTRSDAVVPTRSLLALLAVLAAIPLLSGCGGDSDSDTLSSEAVAKAAEATVAKGGTRISLVSDATLPGGAGELKMTGEGVVDGETQQGRLTLKAISAPSGVSKQSLGQEIVFDKLVLYLRSPVFAAALDDGKKWLKIDLEKAGKAAGIDLASLTQSGQDPSQSLKLLKAVSGDIAEVGKEDVRGVSTTHYKATIDLNKYPDTVPAKDREAARATVKTLTKALGGTKTPVEFWIDEDDLVRRYGQTLKIDTGGGQSAIKQTIDYYDYGAEVDVTIPPADEVQDFSDIAASGLSGGTP